MLMTEETVKNYLRNSGDIGVLSVVSDPRVVVIVMIRLGYSEACWADF